jgi:outer membrane protein assembly factor BamB
MQYVDDGLIFAGKVNGQAVVLKTDFQFNVVWQSDGFSLYGFGFNTIEPYDNGWISLARGKFANFTAVGDTIWTYTAVDYSTSLFDCKVSSDNNIYILGYYKLWRVNSEGQSLELVADSIPAGYPLNEIVSLEVLPNGNLVYLSRSSTNQILHCYNPDGTLQWSRSYNTFGAIYFGKGSKNLLVMPDGSILFPMHHGTIVLVKTDSEGNVVANDDPIAPVFVSSIMAYPQPASSTVMISVKSDLVGDLGYSIFNIRGQRIYSGKINGHHKDQSFELPNEVLDIIPNGIYLISLDLGNSKIATTKLVVVK